MDEILSTNGGFTMIITILLIPISLLSVFAIGYVLKDGYDTMYRNIRFDIEDSLKDCVNTKIDRRIQELEERLKKNESALMKFRFQKLAGIR